jgi:hypothetical protein
MFLYGDEDEGILLIVPAILPLSLNYILLFFHSPAPPRNFRGFIFLGVLQRLRYLSVSVFVPSCYKGRITCLLKYECACLKKIIILYIESKNG